MSGRDNVVSSSSQDRTIRLVIYRHVRNLFGRIHRHVGLVICVVSSGVSSIFISSSYPCQSIGSPHSALSIAKEEFMSLG